jgi:hypothetical protein
VDLGLLYDGTSLDLPALRDAAARLHGAPVDVAGPGGWGPWVDGGAWLSVDGTAVDLILREVQRVRTQRDRALRGEFAVHHQTGHPLGFLDVAYAAEVAICRPLAGDAELVEELRDGLDPYPRPLRDALIGQLSIAEFIIGGAATALPRGDLAYLQMCAATALMWCAHAWHAKAGVWVTNEKGLVPGVAGLPIDTDGFTRRALEALATTDPRSSLAAVADLVASTRAALG